MANEADAPRPPSSLSNNDNRGPSLHISFDEFIELLTSESKQIRELNDASKSTAVAMQLVRLCGDSDNEINNRITDCRAQASTSYVAPGKLPHLQQLILILKFDDIFELLNYHVILDKNR